MLCSPIDPELALLTATGIMIMKTEDGDGSRNVGKCGDLLRQALFRGGQSIDWNPTGWPLVFHFSNPIERLSQCMLL